VLPGAAEADRPGDPPLVQALPNGSPERTTLSVPLSGPPAGDTVSRAGR
jgi:hypothetical protein